MDNTASICISEYFSVSIYTWWLSSFRSAFKVEVVSLCDVAFLLVLLDTLTSERMSLLWLSQCVTAFSRHAFSYSPFLQRASENLHFCVIPRLSHAKNSDCSRFSFEWRCPNSSEGNSDLHLKRNLVLTKLAFEKRFLLRRISISIETAT